MNNFFTYFSGVVYSVKQCLLTWKKPKRYPIFAFIISCIMLLAPVQFSFINTPIDTIVNQIPNIEVVLSNAAIDLNSKNIEVKIENNKVVTSENYQKYIDGFMVYIGIDFEEYPEVDQKEKKDTDNIIIFDESYFYARYTYRADNNDYQGISVLSGNYSKVNSFNFNEIYECKNDKQVYLVVGTFLNYIYLTNSSNNLLSWTFIIEIFNLLFILIGGFLLLYINKKGNRDYKLTYGQSFLTVMGSLVLPAFLATIIGMFSFSFFTITYVVVAFIRLIRLCYAQLSSNTKYNQLEVQEDPNNFELNLK